MKNLTIFLLIVTFAFINFQSFAQILGIKAGLNISDCAIKEYDNTPLYTVPAFGINLGGTLEFKIGDKYSLESGLTLNDKGLKIPISGGTDTITHLKYLDIPFNAKYSFSLSKNKLYLSVGPYLGIGLNGIYSWKDSKGEYNAKKVQWGNNGAANEIKRLDYGINLGAEYVFRAFGVGLLYGVGLANIRGSGYESSSQRNRVLSIYLAYKFGKK